MVQQRLRLRTRQQGNAVPKFGTRLERALSMSMRIMQLADSAFPAGGLNHSQGLEAAMQSGRVQCAAGLKLYAIEVLQLQVTALPCLASPCLA